MLEASHIFQPFQIKTVGSHSQMMSVVGAGSQILLKEGRLREFCTNMGEGIQNSECFADVICEWPLRASNPLTKPFRFTGLLREVSVLQDFWRIKVGWLKHIFWYTKESPQHKNGPLALFGGCVILSRDFLVSIMSVPPNMFFTSLTSPRCFLLRLKR